MVEVSPVATLNDSRPSADDAPAQPVRALVFAAVALVAGVLFTSWIETGSRQTVSAFLQVRTVSVTAERLSRVEQIPTPTGTRITIGDPLLVLSDSQLLDAQRALAQKIETLTAELSQARTGAEVELALQHSAVDERICEVRLQKAGYQHEKFESDLRRRLLADVLASHETALWDNSDPLLNSLVIESRWPDSSRTSTMAQLESCSQTAELHDSNLQICDERLEGLQLLRESLPERIREARGVGVLETRLRHAEEEARQLTSQQTRLTVTSPAVGQIGVYRVRPGDQVQAGDAIVELLDDSQRYLVAEVPSRLVHQFAAGRTVTLLFPGEEKRQGRVHSIAPQARPRVNEPDAIIEVEIEPAGRLWPLVPIGTRIDVVVEKPL